MQIFDSKLGLIAEEKEYVRDVTADLVIAKAMISDLKERMSVEEIIKLVQKSCSLTNDEVYGIVMELDGEINPRIPAVEVTESMPFAESV